MLKLGWFSALTKSARNSILTRSVKLKPFAKERFITVRRGPRSEFLPSLPNSNNCVADGVGGAAKALVLNQQFVVPVGPEAVMVPPGVQLPEPGFPTTSRYQLQPLLTSPPVAVPPTLQPVIFWLRLVVLTTVNGVPL